MPLLPTNGILLSRDLHHAFENYAFSLDENNRVIISKSVHKDSELRNFVGNKVSPIIHETYKPYDDYVKFHRDAFYLKEK